jgi:hypothetical protein
MRFPTLDSGALRPLEPGPAGGRADGLSGAWSATRWEYRSADEACRADLVCDLGGAVTLGLSAELWVLTFAVPGRGMRSIGGTYAADGNVLVLRGSPDSERVVIRYRRQGDTLSWSDMASGWDFDADGRDEPATLVAVFVRI